MAEKRKKLTPWGRLRIQAGNAKRHGKHKQARKLHAKADRLEKAAAKKKPAAKKKAGRKKAAPKGKGMTAALAHIHATSRNLGLTPQQTVDVFRAGIRTTLSNGLDR